MGIKEIIGGLVSPVTKVIERRQARVAAREAAVAKLSAAGQDSEYKLEFSDQELEQLMTQGLGASWKDEYVTVSIVSVFNLLVVGGIAAGFGQPQVLEGLSYAMAAITASGVDFGFIMEATIMSAIGLSVWRKM